MGDNTVIIRIDLSQTGKAKAYKNKYIKACHTTIGKAFKKYPDLQLLSEVKKTNDKATAQYEIDLSLVKATISPDNIGVEIKGMVTKGGKLLHRDIPFITKGAKPQPASMEMIVDAVVTPIMEYLLPKIKAHSRKG
jgi:hypothetical protein